MRLSGSQCLARNRKHKNEVIQVARLETMKEKQNSDESLP